MPILEAIRCYGNTKNKTHTQSKVPPIDFHAKSGAAIEYSVSGNMNQSSSQQYTLSGTSPLSFNADGNDLTALSMNGNMNQASSQPYTVSGTSPISFMNNGTAIDYTVSGGMSQSGTPTPTNPITPEECGERTGNLFDTSKMVSGLLTESGTISPSERYSTSDYIEVSASTAYTISGISAYTAPRLIRFSYCDSSKEQISTYRTSAFSEGAFTFTVTTPENTKYVRFSLIKYGGAADDENVMFNIGSTKLPYEPYGYKIPITNGSTTYNIYLSEPLRKIGDYVDIVNSNGNVTRQIKKLVLTGSESFTYNSEYTRFSLPITDALILGTRKTPAFCTHYQCIDDGRAISNVPNNSIYGAAGSVQWYLHTTDYSTETDLKSYLAQQYEDGTPVTVWYILSTTQTETITVPTITPTSGNNTLTVDTTLAPSNITITSNSSVFPGNPIIPIECGVKTENLFDYKTVYAAYIDADGNVSANASVLTAWNSFSADMIGKTFTISFFVSSIAASYIRMQGQIDSEYITGNAISAGQTGFTQITVTPTSVSDRWRITYGSGTFAVVLNQFVVAESSTRQDYEPYGKYKIPITIGSTTKNIFINQPIRKIGDYSDSIGSDGIVTRNIKKLVLTGTETMTYAAVITDTDAWQFPNDASDYYRTDFVVSHMPVNTSSTSTESHGYIGQRLTLCFDKQLGLNTNSAIETYLANQYSAGTPVEVWYVLETPDTTETTTIPTISTVNGSNTLTTGTPITPSNITISTSSSVYPKNPIYPEECGDRTTQLFDYVTMANGKTGYFLTDDGGESAASAWAITDYIPCNGTEFTVNALGGQTPAFCLYDENKQYITGKKYDTGSAQIKTAVTITSSQTAKFIRFSWYRNNDSAYDNPANIMLNTGSTTLPYEPYGYKIPITINSNTQNVYTKEPIRKIGNYSDIVNSDGTVTRQIKKLVLTGQESWIVSPAWKQTNTSVFYFNSNDIINISAENTIFCVSEHFEAATRNELYNGDTDMIARTGTGSITIRISDTLATTTTAFQTYLAAQYSAGTPVNVWYVLATPTEETITPPVITPQVEKNTIEVDTTLQPSNLSITYTSPDYSEIIKVYDNQGALLYRQPQYYNWKAIKSIVRQGLAPQYYPIGYIFYDNFNPNTGTAYQVVAYNKHFDTTLTAQGYTHSMTLCQLKLDLRQFDATESLMSVTTAMPAGTYKFTIPNYDASYGGNKTYYFTTTVNIPVDGVITLNWPYQQTPKTVTTYATSISTTALDSALTLTEWDESITAIDLGTVTYSDTASTGSYGIFNHIQRARYGSNNYHQSGLRQLLNTDAAANTWWQPTTIFDRPYSNRTIAGYLSTLNPDFVNALATPEITYITNNVFEYQSLDGTTFTKNTNYTINTDKMFLLSHTEVNLSSSPNIGSILDYYVNADNTKRIKYRKDNNNAYYWWLRTPYPSYAGNERYVSSSGALNNNSAYISHGLAPACIIQ